MNKLTENCELLAIDDGAVVCPKIVSFVGASCKDCQYHQGIQQQYTIRYVLCSHWYENRKRALPPMQSTPAPMPGYERGDLP